MYILGISAYYHDSAACLIRNAEIIAAAQEERFTRKKHDSSFPSNAINFCLTYEKIDLESVDYIVFYDKPFLKFERIFETYLSFAPKGIKNFQMSMPLWIKDKLFQKRKILIELQRLIDKNINLEEKLLFSEHHLSHAASAFYPSPFEEAAILTMDGVGEWSTTSVSIGKKNKISILKEINFPHSIGLFYSAFTYYLGFKVNSGEYKLMGLAPYGEPRFVKTITDNLIDIKKDGSFALKMDFFDFCVGDKMTNQKFNSLFGRKERQKEAQLTQLDMDIAASVQQVTNEVVLSIVKNVKKETCQKNLCLAGGVALNCVTNGLILKEQIFENIWVQPAAGDAGGSLGSALAVYYDMLKNDRLVIPKNDTMKGSYLGVEFSKMQIQEDLEELNAVYKKIPMSNLVNIVAKKISEGKIIGWMNGRMEFGPRALGNRSILADPRDNNMQKKLNLRIKYRESFRPFAPSVMKENLSEWFSIKSTTPYMLFTSQISKKVKINNSKEAKGLQKLKLQISKLPAVTHVDYSARVQSVDKEINPVFHSLLEEFKKITGCPMLINTSFNIRGEPIVASPKDAYECFMGTDMDMLVIGNYLLIKEEQPENQKKGYRDKFSLD